ncbi:MAG: hypothetical protein KF894_16555 [Labilithrix sp.]|nr:hypothetical protein [Labilithrix sp.]
METRRVYSETLPYAELVRPRTIALLARYRLELVLAVRPWDEPELPRVARALRDGGVPLSVWPMLSDDDGRWASAHNAPQFSRLVLSVCDALDRGGAPPRDVLFDLEPPFAHARALASMGSRGTSTPAGLAGLASGLTRATSGAFDAASRALGDAVAEVHARGIATSTAVWPLVALDRPGGQAWQSLLGTPVDALGAGHVSVMMYTSILEGWSRRALRRRDVTALLAAATSRAVRRWGSSAGISLGCVGTGALDDEPTYRDPSELAEDAAVARAAGCDKLTLFELGGVLAREPAEAWLDAFAAGGAASVGGTSKRVRVARTVARAATWALGRRR